MYEISQRYYYRKKIKDKEYFHILNLIFEAYDFLLSSKVLSFSEKNTISCSNIYGFLLTVFSIRDNLENLSLDSIVNLYDSESNFLIVLVANETKIGRAHV